MNFSIKLETIKKNAQNSLVVQWLGLGIFTARALGSIPSQGTKIPQAAMYSQKKCSKSSISDND